ncbi:Major facilitator superfamily domain general substrate transporter protein [Rutstroemia sp. NJR-2017a BBW]|nr:Major facilitator superfamily domain general substrate transporter protein [Rutstroemia sp. NJR-2017a BBW]
MSTPQRTPSHTSPSLSPAPSSDLKTPLPASFPTDPDPEPALPSSSSPLINHQAERALCRKFDFRLLPVLACMYLFNSLDKGNLGNAKTDGLEKDLGFRKNQYNTTPANHQTSRGAKLQWYDGFEMVFGYALSFLLQSADSSHIPRVLYIF